MNIKYWATVVLIVGMGLIWFSGFLIGSAPVATVQPSIVLCEVFPDGHIEIHLPAGHFSGAGASSLEEAIDQCYEMASSTSEATVYGAGVSQTWIQ